MWGEWFKVTPEQLEASRNPNLFDNSNVFGPLLSSLNSRRNSTEPSPVFQECPCSPEVDPKNVEYNNKLSCDMADKALQYYKTMEGGGDYELVEIKSRECGFRPLHWICHLYFEAKLKDDDDSQAQLFFAEVYMLCRNNDDELEVQNCFMLDNPKGFQFSDDGAPENYVYWRPRPRFPW